MCKWYKDEFCTNAECPYCADFCPVAQDDKICKYRESDVTTATDEEREQQIKRYIGGLPKGTQKDIWEYINSLKERIKSFDNVTILRPKMRFDEVIRKYGYPFISKEVSQQVYETHKKPDGWASKKFDRESDYCKRYGDRFCLEKWKPLLSIDFNLSHICCKEMKKYPSFDFEKKTNKKPFLATMAEESALRETKWLKTGCNAFQAKRETSQPLSFWTEQDILAYIKQNNLPISSVYGDIVYGEKDGAQYDNLICDCGQKLCTTKCDRTGCIFCGFGPHLEKGESRFERLKKTHPRQYEYCMGGGAYDTDGLWKPTKEGLGMAHCIDEINNIYGKDFIRY